VLRGTMKPLSWIGMVRLSLPGPALPAGCRDLLHAHGIDISESGSLLARIADPALPWGGNQRLLAVGADSGLYDRHLQQGDRQLLPEMKLTSGRQVHGEML
jgi:hypothetical protein